MNAVTNTPAAQATPDNAETQKPETAKPLVLVAKELPYDMLLKLDAGMVDDLAQRFAKQGKKFQESKQDLADATKAVAKVYAVLEVRLNSMKAQNFAPANKPLGEFIKDITGEKPPTHALTLKNTFGAYVMTGFNSEEDYDSNSNNCLELAQKIVAAVKGNLQHEAVRKAANELHSRTDKEAKNLREILATVKPTAKITAKEAIEMIEAIAEDGQLAVVFAQLPDLFEEMAQQDQKDHYRAFTCSLEKVDAVLGDNVDVWLKEMADAAKGVQVLAAGKPVETPAEAVAA